MKTFCAAAALVTCATAAQAADFWTCAYPSPVQPVLMRLAVAATNVTDVKSGDVYVILQDNEYGLVAARGVAEVKIGERLETTAASAIVIRKKTGEFRYGTMTISDAPPQSAIRGMCMKD